MNKEEVGKKIRHLRKISGLSQMQLEVAANAAPGSISRIENGKVNPSKETLNNIANALNLTPTVRSYLFGASFREPTAEDISKAINEVHPILYSKNSLSYLLNLRSQILCLSEGFKQLCKEHALNPEDLIDKSVLEVFFDPKLATREFFTPRYFDSMGIHILAVVIQERNFLLHEPWWNDHLNRLFEFPDVSRLWKEAKNTSPNLYTREARTIYFETNKGTLRTELTISSLYSYPDISIVQYNPY